MRKTIKKACQNLLRIYKSLVHKENIQKKYLSLIENLSGVISEEGLEKLSLEDEKVRYILRENR